MTKSNGTAVAMISKQCLDHCLGGNTIDIFRTGESLNDCTIPLYLHPSTILTTHELNALLRLSETCEDGEGYDVPVEMMHRLAKIGVVQHLHDDYYEITEFGDLLLEGVGEK